MVKKAINEYTPQEIINNMLDPTVDALVPVIGTAQYASGLGWVKTPVSGHAYRQWDWTSGNLDYFGIHTDIAASDDDTDWIIFKFVWDASGNPTSAKQRKTSWTGRASGW